MQNSFHHGWLAKANTGADGKAVLTAVDVVPLHAAVLKACDGLDGLVDGQITDPRRCPTAGAVASIACKGAYEAGKCLTTAQLATVRKIYSGARSPSGKLLEVGPLMPGSELEWVGVFVPRTAEGRIGSMSFALDTVNHLLWTPNPTYTIANFPFTEAMLAREEQARKLYNADDPNIAAFAARGGKLLLWHGWSDPHISPLNTIDYWARVGRALGADKRDAFVRMFLFPGMSHCSGGDGPDEFPLLANLMAWVEGGQAPEAMVAHRAKPTGFGQPTGQSGGQKGAVTAGGPPPDVAAEMQRKAAELAQLGPRSRPVYAYPKIARYTGTGSVNEAASFAPATPPPSAVREIARWAGSRP